MDSSPNKPLLDAHRVVVKLGTQVVINETETTVAQERMHALVAACAQLHKAGREVILVSSGAVGLGRKKLGLEKKLSLSQKQACAAVGQNLLMDAYQELFNQHGIVTAQVLLTAMDLAERRHYLNLRQTLETLLDLKVIPVINENDSVSTMELQNEAYIKGFGDNDKLSAIVGAKLDADLLVILTNVNGIYTENPANNPDAKQVTVIEDLQQLKAIQTAGQSAMGRGGMASKLEAVHLAAICGLHTYVTSGFHPNPLAELQDASAEMRGTLVYPRAMIKGKKRWIGMGSSAYGIVVVNEGARTALLEKRASLLPVGVVDVKGDFQAGQVISIQDERGMEIGRGLSFFSVAEIGKIKGCKSDKIADCLGTNHPAKDRHEVIHRDNLVIFEETEIA